MKKVVILGLFAMPFFFASCGGGEADGETTGADSTVVTEEIEIIEATYTVDTDASVINWNNFDGEEIDHKGTVNVLNGSMDITTTNGVSEITAASLTVDMNSISEGSEKLEGHLKDADFFDVNTYATTSFAFDRHENDMIYGTATIVGKEVAIEAPIDVTVGENGVVIEVGEFEVDFTALGLPFFTREAAEKPAEEHHNPVIGFSATITGSK